MSIDFEIALCLDVQIHTSVPGQLRQHVIEERNARLDLVLAGSVQIQADLNIRFIRLARLGNDSGFIISFSNALSSAARNRCSVRACRQ